MTRNKLLYGGVTLGLMAGAFVVGTAVAKGPAKTAPDLLLLKDAQWTPLMKEGPLPAVAPIQGDGSKGAYEGYLKLPAGFESPPHSHTNDYWSVLVQGKMTHWAANGGSEKDAKQLGVGDLTFMPGKLEHISKCYPGADCILVVVQKGKFDFIPAKVAAKPADKGGSGGGEKATAAKAGDKPAEKTTAAAPAPAAPAAPAKK
jgi:hypothetical protein